MKNYSEARKKQFEVLLSEYLEALESLEESPAPFVKNLLTPTEEDGMSVLDSIVLNKMARLMQEYAVRRENHS